MKAIHFIILVGILFFSLPILVVSQDEEQTEPEETISDGVLERLAHKIIDVFLGRLRTVLISLNEKMLESLLWALKYNPPMFLIQKSHSDILAVLSWVYVLIIIAASASMAISIIRDKPSNQIVHTWLIEIIVGFVMVRSSMSLSEYLQRFSSSLIQAFLHEMDLSNMVNYPDVSIVLIFINGIFILLAALILCVRHLAVLSLTLLLPIFLAMYFFKPTKQTGHTCILFFIAWVFLPVPMVLILKPAVDGLAHMTSGLDGFLKVMFSIALFALLCIAPVVTLKLALSTKHAKATTSQTTRIIKYVRGRLQGEGD